jgi:hypothetical protein
MFGFRMAADDGPAKRWAFAPFATTHRTAASGTIRSFDSSTTSRKTDRLTATVKLYHILAARLNERTNQSATARAFRGRLEAENAWLAGFECFSLDLLISPSLTKVPAAPLPIPPETIQK